MNRFKPLFIALFALLALLLLGLPLYHLFATPAITLELQGDCRQGPPGCLLKSGDMEVRLVVGSNSLRLHSNQPLASASVQLRYEEDSPAPLKMYSVGHRREWAAASAEPLAEFPGEALSLELTLLRDDRFYTANLTAEPHGN